MSAKKWFPPNYRWAQAAIRASRHIADCLFPHHCVLCHAPASQYLCGDCLADLPHLGHSCNVCALPLNQPGICGECLKRPPEFSRAYCAFEYRALSAKLIIDFKDRKALHAGRFLSDSLCKRMHTLSKCDTPDALIPVPSHWRTRWQRGFNQAEFIAQELSNRLNIPMRSILRKTSYTARQKTLNRRQREKNLVNNFSLVTSAPPNTHVALIDDVITTGATANHLAQLLKKHGAGRVDVWALARTPKPGQ